MPTQDFKGTTNNVNITGTGTPTLNVGTGGTLGSAAYTEEVAPTVISDFIVADGAPVAWVKKTLAETKTILGVGGTTLTIDGKTGAYTVLAADNGKAINCTANSFEVALTAAATLGNGFNCWIWNTSGTSTHIITINPDGAETIGGASTYKLYPGEGIQIICTGTAFIIGATRKPFLMSSNVTGVTQAQATGANSLAIGPGTTSSGANSVALGIGSVASGSGAICLGTSTDNPAASGTGSVAIGGAFCGAEGSNSMAFGAGAKSRLTSKYTFAVQALSDSNAGECQSGLMQVRVATTDATPTVLKADGSAAGASNQLTLPNNSTYNFRVMVVGMEKASEGGDSAAYTFTGIIQRLANAASTTLLASAKTVDYETNAAWDCALSADTTNGSLAITVTGVAATNIRWIARIDTVEVLYP